MNVKVFFDADRASRHMGIGTETMLCTQLLGNIFILKNTPIARCNLSYGDQVVCKADTNNSLRFIRRHKAGTFSTFRMFSKANVKPELLKFEEVLDQIQSAGCGVTCHLASFIATVSVPIEINLDDALRFATEKLGAIFHIEVTANRQKNHKSRS
jgi:hypothetical protein